ncbi:MAG TPA: DUF1579 domain-containing protein [Acidobacteriota bacterium]|nr:DUF1579 domain-containing protein [Acidobacteriota bacterium]
MTRSIRLAALAALFAAGALTLVPASGALAQGRPDPAALLAAQREAMKALASMNGVWRGPAWTIRPDGGKHEITQTERIGPFLDGTLKVIEGRGYDADGTVSFNAFGVVSFDPAKKAYAMRSHAQGQSGDFVFTPTADGYSWEIPAGPMTIRYTATIKDGVLHEVGDRIVPGKDPVRFFEMTLTRVGDTDWPAGGAVPMK